MATKMPRRQAEPAPAAAPADLPDPDRALRALAGRQALAVVFLLVRLFSLALLATLLVVQAPGLRPYRPLLDAVSILLALWPFLTAYGRSVGWRIALGRAYAGAGRWADAERTLAPLAGWRARPFDAAGEGLFWLAMALRARGSGSEARTLMGRVAAPGGGSPEWQERARAELGADGEETPG